MESGDWSKPRIVNQGRNACLYESHFSTLVSLDLLKSPIQLFERIFCRDDENRAAADGPIVAIQRGSQGSGEHPVVVHQLTADCVMAAVWYGPIHALFRPRQHLELAGGQLGKEFALPAGLLTGSIGRVQVFLPAP
ncbi:hypothetical protein SDC9_189129 [bioreactor metagenome]|uniref:Uncharacterized protein n=1 Tax=bioreactor metagenome TaxID=1076179 RepID=A0A645HRA5_9ZZZZ